MILLSGTGIGNTTLMHYISHKRVKDNLWNDNYDNLFRVRLKELWNYNQVGKDKAQQE